MIAPTHPSLACFSSARTATARRTTSAARRRRRRRRRRHGWLRTRPHAALHRLEQRARFIARKGSLLMMVQRSAWATAATMTRCVCVVCARNELAASTLHRFCACEMCAMLTTFSFILRFHSAARTATLRTITGPSPAQGCRSDQRLTMPHQNASPTAPEIIATTRKRRSPLCNQEPSLATPVRYYLFNSLDYMTEYLTILMILYLMIRFPDRTGVGFPHNRGHHIRR